MDVERQVVHVYASPAAEAWLPLVYTCAERSPELLVARTLDIASANLILRVGETPILDATPYQIDEVELVVVANAENTLPELETDQIKAIFEGNIRNWAEVGGEDANIQLWIFAAGDDYQVASNEGLFGGGIISSLAQQAQSPRAMREAIQNDIHAIGLLAKKDVEGAMNLQILSTESVFLPILVLPWGDKLVKSPTLLNCLQGVIDS
ncbi:MAG: hypothetical protein HN975_13310 [Anaerolineae bacterium]|nr:hypothetical protein [Anaerolineae bacterium]